MASKPEVSAGKRVFMADDEIDIRCSMAALLATWGLKVHAADTPHSAGQLFRGVGRLDLMIVDLRPGATEHGATLASHLRRVHGEFPVLIITGQTSSKAPRQANEVGFALLQKPIAPEVLHQAAVEASIHSAPVDVA
jgi:two-component system, sensor histidine kinase